MGSRRNQQRKRRRAEKQKQAEADSSENNTTDPGSYEREDTSKSDSEGDEDMNESAIVDKSPTRFEQIVTYLEGNEWIIPEDGTIRLVVPQEKRRTEIYDRMPAYHITEMLRLEFSNRYEETADDNRYGGYSYIAMREYVQQTYGRLDKEPMTTAEWVHLFQDAFEYHLKDSEDGSALRQLATDLAHSDPHQFFGNSEWDHDERLFQNADSVVWQAATLYIGAMYLYKQPVALLEQPNKPEDTTKFKSLKNSPSSPPTPTAAAKPPQQTNNKTPPNKPPPKTPSEAMSYNIPVNEPPSSYWQSLNKQEQNRARPFTYADKVKQKSIPRSIPRECTKGAQYMNIESRKVTMNDWSSLFLSVFDPTTPIAKSSKGIEFRAFSVDLAHTNPKILFPNPMDWHGTALSYGPFQNPWIAAIQTLGCLYTDSALPSTQDDKDDNGSVAASTLSDAHTVRHHNRNTYQTKITPDPNLHVLRYDFRLKVPPSEQPDLEMIALTRVWFEKMKEADPSICLLTWKEEDSFEPIRSHRHIPETIGAFRKFFNRAQPKPDGGFVYSGVRLGHDRPFPEIQEDIGWWFRTTNHGLYEKSIQTEDSLMIGWLLYSHNVMDSTALRDALRIQLGTSHIGCRFRVISTGRRGKPDATKATNDDEDPIKAIHIECARTEYTLVKNKLARIYCNRANQDFPLGIRMRLVPVASTLLSAGSISKIEMLRLKQANYTAKTEFEVVDDIGAIDSPHPDLDNRTLRQMVMSIESQEFPGNKLFESLDLRWNKQGHSFLYLTHLDNEAHAMIQALLPYLRHFHGDTVERWFKPSAISRAQGAEWDPSFHCLRTEADEYIDWMTAENAFLDDENATGPPIIQTPASQRPPPTDRFQRKFLSDDQDSISTMTDFKSLDSTNRNYTTRPAPDPSPEETSIPRPSAPETHQPKPTPTDSSSISESVASRLSIVEQHVARMQSVENSLNNLTSMFTRFVEQQTAPHSDVARSLITPSKPPGTSNHPMEIEGTPTTQSPEEPYPLGSEQAVSETKQSTDSELAGALHESAGLA